MSHLTAILISVFISIFGGSFVEAADKSSEIPPVPKDAISIELAPPIMGAVSSVECGNGIGTGVVIKTGQIITDEHVIRGEKDCTFNGKPFTTEKDIVYRDPIIDLAIINVDTGDMQVAKYVCAPLKRGGNYVGIGYPEGFYTRREGAPQIVMLGTFPNSTFHTVIPVYLEAAPVATMLTGAGFYKNFPAETKNDFPSPHLSVVQGYVRPGMSGGPVFNERWEVVGLINALSGSNIGLIRELLDTPLCKSR